MSNTFNALIKRLTDIIGAVICIIIFSPVMLVSAILVKTTSKGPLIFKQERVGLHNKPFQMYKFRTMYVQTEEEERKGWTQKNDPRVTSVGRFLRKTSLDEFPQLFNVLKGDMSLVGTRPPTMDEYNQYELHHKSRLAAKPGLTGMWQVSGRSDFTDFEEIVKMDSDYIKNWNIGLDIKIILKTVLVVLGQKGSV